MTRSSFPIRPWRLDWYDQDLGACVETWTVPEVAGVLEAGGSKSVLLEVWSCGRFLHAVVA